VCASSRSETSTNKAHVCYSGAALSSDGSDSPGPVSIGPPSAGPLPPGSSTSSTEPAHPSPLQATVPTSPSAAIDPPGVTTCLQHRIRKVQTRTDDIVAWSVARAPADPTLTHTEHCDSRTTLSLPHWRTAMETEFSVLQLNKTSHLIPLSSGVNIIDCK
jgi:hypothetical protein